jgi:hypothetical protein
VTLFLEALRCARLGPVLPLEPRGKNPLARLVRHGVGHATTDYEVLRDWWGRAPDANVGIACRDLLVVDVDVRHGGDAELALLLAEHGPFPRTPTARTGSGGTHVLFRRPAWPLLAKLRTGVDLVHGARRYIVAPPSLHPCGERYRWTTPPSVPAADAPEWLVAMARRPEPMPVGVPRLDTPSDERMRRARAYAAVLDPAISGQHGHDTTFRVAVRVARGFALSEDEALAVLAPWNASCRPPWNERDLRRKVREALEHGDLPMGALLERERRVA